MRALILLLAAGLGVVQAQPAPMSVAPGYDNQPMFSPDGRRLLFAANRDGKQIDIFMFERASGRVSQLTETAQNENSPTFVPAGMGDAGSFSVVQTEPDRSQRLWRFNAAGKNPQLVLADVKPVGYHAWVEPDHLAMFILGQPATLQVGRVSTGKAEVMARDIGRSLHRIPGTRLVSFVQRESPTEFWIRQIDIDSRQIASIVTTPGCRMARPS